MPEKKGHRFLSALLELTLIRNQYGEPYAQLKRQSVWVVELARLFEPCDKQGQAQTARQVKREVKQFLERLEQEAIDHPDDARVIVSIVNAVRHRW